MNNDSEWCPILHSKSISKQEIYSLNRQLEKIPTIWKNRFMKDKWQLIITDKMAEEHGGAFGQYFADGSNKQIWLNVAIPTIYDNIIYKAFACYAYMEYGNIKQWNSFKEICKENEYELKIFLTLRGLFQYDEMLTFVEVFSYVIETDFGMNNTRITSLYNYLKKWVTGEIFSVDLSKVPNYMDIGRDVLNEQVEDVTLAFNMLPNGLKHDFIRNGWRIYLSNEKIVGGKIIQISTYGLCSSLERKIFLRSSSPKLRITTWHEFGHYLDYREGFASGKFGFKTVYFSERNYLRNIYDTDFEFDYAVSNTEEYFAELFANYMKDSESLKLVAPRSSETMKKIITRWM